MLGMWVLEVPVAFASILMVIGCRVSYWLLLRAYCFFAPFMIRLKIGLFLVGLLKPFCMHVPCADRREIDSDG